MWGSARARCRFRAIVDGSSTAVALLDVAGRRRNVSPGAARLLGVEAADLGRSIGL